MLTLKEIVFPSGAKANYLFATTDILESKSQIDEIQELSDFSIQGPLTETMNEESPRHREFLLSRYLLLHLLKDFKKKNIRGVALSLSHTKGAALVVGIPNISTQGTALASGIGADLEKLDRKISDSAFKRLLVEENEKNILPLNLWCLKEAAFKAHPKNQTVNDGLLLSDFIVREDQSIECARSPLKFEAIILDEDSYKMVFARLLV